ncbi:DCC1-like thiol-disulfide oxidoreductase family protein [Nocardioides lijunqiniae]|uniref:DCC1-like thiol-disulfide oxidoreductase family protein n=1 Tax=Nocardioides lijunqiniae TaxID=2760832 RepID=UPI0018780252
MLTVLYDADCPLCARFRSWLAGQATLVPLELVAAGSPEARARFPTLDHDRTLAEITVVGDDGSIWTHEHAWVMCLWATRAHRGLAERLARPAWLPLARGAAYSAAGLRSLLASGSDRGGDYPERCAGTCSPLPEG